MPAFFDTGFSVREPMWHRQGAVLADYPIDWADARVKAGLEWEPEIRPMYRHVPMLPTEAAPEGSMAGPNGDGFIPVGSHRLVIRNDTEAVLGSVSDTFALVQHSVMGEILEAVLGLDNVKFETAGSCRGGAQVWALAYLDEPLEVAGDDTATYPFIALLNSHDGTGACKVLPTSIRVVCWNTYNAASMQGEKSGRQFIFHHSSRVLDRIEDAKAALHGVRDDAAAWVKLATELGGLQASDAAFHHFVCDFIPEPAADLISPRVRKNIDTARAAFSRIYESSPTTDGHRGTALGLVDTAVEYLDHVRTARTSDTHIGRTLLRTEPLKAKAVTLARAACTA